MMNLSAAAAASSCDEFGYGAPDPAAPPSASLFPVMDHRDTGGGSMGQRGEHLGYNLEGTSLALLPPSTGGGHEHNATIAAHSPHDILQFYPTSHYHYLAAAAAGSTYSHFNGPGGTFQSYYGQQQAQPSPEYYFPTLVSSAEENMASFAATQLGLNLGYRTYFPARGGYSYGHHPPRCQAEGCKADLSGAKRYHRRHKVCEHHSKAPVVVTAGGLHQRFCQQCSRFHLVDEFDDAKKSCRKRLADHNRRRRKSKPSDADAAAADKRKTQAGKAASTKGKAAGSSSKSTGGSTGGDAMDIHVQLGSSDLSKDQDETMELGDVVKETQLVDSKGKASMQRHGLEQQQQQSHHGFPFPPPSSSAGGGSCFHHHHQSQSVSSDVHTSNMAQVVQEPSLGFHHHQHSNILQLGQAMFDLDFDH